MSDDTEVRTRLLVEGEWRAGGAGRLAVCDPGTGQDVGTVELADEQDVQDALGAATRAFPAWSTMPAAQRGAILKRAAALLTERLDQATRLLVVEAGKTAAEASGELTRAIETLAWNGEEAGRITGHVIQGAVAGSDRLSVPTPLGVVVAVTAANFPAVLTARKLGAALAAGCTVVLKAAESAPATVALIVTTLLDAGLPPGVVNLVFGDPPKVIGSLLASPAVKALTFTGSTQVGRLLAEAAAPGLIRCVLELGGHAPVIVCEDADVDMVVRTTSPAKFGSAGQSCVAPSRYLVHRTRYAEFAAALKTYADALNVGHGTDPDVTMGSLPSQARVDALVGLVEDAVARGARILCGGEPLAAPGFYFAPTVLVDVPLDAEIMTTEPFGPIACVLPYDDFTEAIHIANSTSYGFAAYLFTDSLARRNRAVRELQASNIGVNQMAPSLPDAPLGGSLDSGYGYEGGRDGILAFMQMRLVSQAAP